MDAALVVEEESASVGAADHKSSSSLNLLFPRQKENCEKHANERQKDGEEKIEMDKKYHQISYKDDEETESANEGTSSQGTDTQEEDMVFKRKNGEQELIKCAETAEEKNVSLEEKEEAVSRVVSYLSLQQEWGADFEEDTEHEHIELQQKDKAIDNRIINNKENEEKELEEHQMVQETPMRTTKREEMDSSEQYQEPKAIDVKKNIQDDLVGTGPPKGENEKSDGYVGIARDVGDAEEKTLVADQDYEKPFANVENTAKQDGNNWAKDLSAHTPEHLVHPEPADEKETAPPTSASPLVKIKDEPVDEEYEKALVPQDPAAKIKDEPDTAEEIQTATEQIKISAVFSVGGKSPALDPPAASAAANVPANTSPATSLCVVCSGCKKILLKGQTAFQRKGCPQLYCSPRCLYSSTSPASVPMPGLKKTCHHCLKEIPNPKDVITAPVDSNKLVKDFCSQKCLCAFNHKKDSANSVLVTKCSMCEKPCTVRHEVNFMGTAHKLCSDACFHQFRSSNKLSVTSCVTCGGFCYSADGKSSTLLVDGTSKKFCSQNCVSNFKKMYKKVEPCTMCRVYRTLTEMMESVNSEGNTELFCCSACITAHKVQTVSTSGSALECNQCKNVLVPQYHLAMSDGTIRNFCCFTCVLSFQEAFNKTHTPSNKLNVAPSVSTAQLKSATTAQSTSAESSLLIVTQSSSEAKCSCAQCQRLFFSKPELLEFQGMMYVFCDKSCIDEFRRSHYIIAQCVYCKIEKVVKEVKKISNVDCSFCSEGCKLLYKHDLTKRWGKKHCRSCLYCGSTSQVVMTSIFSGKQEEFCGNECLSQYTLLFCEVAKCSMCKRARKMTESVKWLNDMKHFCNLKCLIRFCNQQAFSAISPLISAKPAHTPVPITIAPAAQSPTSTTTSTTTTTTTTNITALPLAPKEVTPVIANVMSLSGATNGHPSVLGRTALQGAVPTTVKLLGHASTQTDSVKTPSAPRKTLKNKALLCKPMNQNKGTSCKPTTSNTKTQTDETPNKVIVIPLPVPVFVPVPMHLYTQHTLHPIGLPFPVPVPMFLPTTLDSAEQIVETIQKIKEKIPDNPLEADLIMIAEMVAQDNEKNKAVSQEDQDGNFIKDLDLEPLSSDRIWENGSITSASQCGETSDSEKAPESSQAKQSAIPSPHEPVMDLEADFPIERLEHLEQHTQETKTVTTPKLRTRKRNRFSQKKQARKRTEAPQSSASPATADVLNPTRMQSEYGVQAWKSWVRWRETQSNVELAKFHSRKVFIKEDLLQCSTAELSYGLCKFITEVRRPNGETYKSDSIYYLCLGIQQYLFENNRLENIFTDPFYTKFNQAMGSLLKDWKPTILPSGYVHSRVEEDYLWECKQLGAFSPSVLLNTLLYFCTKFFNFKTIAQHRRLSFAHIMRCTRSQNNGSKTSCLRFYPPVHKESKNTSSDDADGPPAKKKKDEEEVLEIDENTEIPLRCPVRLYEFYLSKCSGVVKQHTSIFYLRPERSCIPNSPLWFSHTSLDDGELESILNRILTVREVHLEREKPVDMSDPENQIDV